MCCNSYFREVGSKIALVISFIICISLSGVELHLGGAGWHTTNVASSIYIKPSQRVTIYHSLAGHLHVKGCAPCQIRLQQQMAIAGVYTGTQPHSASHRLLLIRPLLRQHSRDPAPLVSRHLHLRLPSSNPRNAQNEEPHSDSCQL